LMAGSRSISLLSLSELKAEDSKRRDFVEFQPSVLSPEQLPGLPVQDHPFGGQHLNRHVAQCEFGGKLSLTVILPLWESVALGCRARHII
jgi:hypothetical protein